jgi:hypothetical protein
MDQMVVWQAMAVLRRQDAIHPVYEDCIGTLLTQPHGLLEMLMTVEQNDVGLTGGFSVGASRHKKRPQRFQELVPPSPRPGLERIKDMNPYQRNISW